MNINTLLQTAPASTLVEIVKNKTNVPALARKELQARGLIIRGNIVARPVNTPAPTAQQRWCGGCDNTLVRIGESCPTCYHINAD